MVVARVRTIEVTSVIGELVVVSAEEKNELSLPLVLCSAREYRSRARKYTPTKQIGRRNVSMRRAARRHQCRRRDSVHQSQTLQIQYILEV